MPNPNPASLVKKLLIAMLAVTGMAFVSQFDGKTAFSDGLAWLGILLIVWAIVCGVHWYEPSSEEVDEIIRKIGKAGEFRDSPEPGEIRAILARSREIYADLVGAG